MRIVPNTECMQEIVSFPDPFCARARNLKLGGGERPGKGSEYRGGRTRSKCHMTTRIPQPHTMRV